MKKFLSTLLLFALLSPSVAFGWGSLGHDASVLIAEKHLTRKAKKNLAKYLENHPLVYYASWMDDISVYPEYEACKEWHEIAFNPKYKILAGKRALAEHPEAAYTDGLCLAREAMKEATLQKLRVFGSAGKA